MPATQNNDHWIKRIRPLIPKPSLKDNTADVDRLIKGVKKTIQTDRVAIDFSIVKKIPHLLRKSNYDVACVLYKTEDSWRLIDIQSSNRNKRIYGISMDLGTSTVVVRFHDLITGEIQEETSFLNPQFEIGPDILTRIHYAKEQQGLQRLQTLLMERLNKEISRFSETYEIDTTAIVGMSMAGNTTMTHFFLGMDPYWICREPYIPAINSPDFISAKDLGININSESPILILPSVGSYFGGDLIAGILASGIYHHKDLSILVDVGTNAEVVFGNNEWLMACAGAAGPALEGGVAHMGMMAGSGAIDKVIIDPHSKAFRVRTIEDKPPIGICGSGLIDLIAQLFLAGMIDIRGRYVPMKCGKRLREIDGVGHLILVYSKDSGTGDALTLSQTDIDALLRSKAAMYTILTTLTKMISLPLKNIHTFYIAGTFGSYIDPISAITIGMIPDLPAETYIPLGNTSLEGASLALLSLKARNKAYRIRDRVTYIELNVNQEFMNHFNAAKFIPHTDRSLFPSVKQWSSNDDVFA